MKKALYYSCGLLPVIHLCMLFFFARIPEGVRSVYFSFVVFLFTFGFGIGLLALILGGATYFYTSSPKTKAAAQSAVLMSLAVLLSTVVLFGLSLAFPVTI